MSVRRINGFQFENMVRNGLANLQLSEAEVNRLNVFPVPDGDTGTNMCLTLANGVNMAQSHGEIGLYLKELSEGMLLGARGNSGVILSQLFKGMWLELARCTVAGPGELRNALIRSYRVAYSSVIQPVEGTILTVAREGIEHIRSQIGRGTGIDNLLAMLVAEMRKTLSYTPEMLGVLKEAGVVDSGAMGYILIFEGMLKYLYGEVLEPRETAAPAHGAPTTGSLDPELFNENSSFEDGYCMEFILQLLRDPKYTQRFRLQSFIDDLQIYGNSLVVIQDGTRVKVHIHTHKPAKVIMLCQEFGEFLSFKLENMQLQHNEHIRQTTASGPQKALATVAVVSGEGMETCFRDLGCDAVIPGGGTMNPSAQDFLDAFRSLNAACIAVLPNNGNAILAAQQAASLFGGSRIEVLPSKNMVEGYFALAMDVGDSSDADYRLRQMLAGIEGVVTLGQCTASRDYRTGELSCRAGEEIVLHGDELLAAGADPVNCILAALRALPGMDERESCLLFRGAGADEQQEESLQEALQEAYPMLEISCVEADQPLYRWLIGLT